MYIGKAWIDPDSKQKDSYLKRYGKDANHMLIETFSGEGVIASPLIKYKDYNIRICRPYGIVESDLRRVIEQVIGKRMNIEGFLKQPGRGFGCGFIPGPG